MAQTGFYKPINLVKHLNVLYIVYLGCSILGHYKTSDNIGQSFYIKKSAKFGCAKFVLSNK